MIISEKYFGHLHIFCISLFNKCMTLVGLQSCAQTPLGWRSSWWNEQHSVGVGGFFFFSVSDTFCVPLTPFSTSKHPLFKIHQQASPFVLSPGCTQGLLLLFRCERLNCVSWIWGSNTKGDADLEEEMNLKLCKLLFSCVHCRSF